MEKEKNMIKEHITAEVISVPTVTVAIGNFEPFTSNVIHDTVDTFAIDYPIPVSREYNGRFAEDMIDSSFAEFLAEQGIFGKGKSKKEELCYWIKDSDAYYDLVNQLFQIIEPMEKNMNALSMEPNQKNNHASGDSKDPYTKEDLEYLLRGVVYYEAEEPDDLGRINLESMGFSEEDMIYFGYHEMMEDKRR